MCFVLRIDKGHNGQIKIIIDDEFLQGLTMRREGHAEVEAWLAVLKYAIAIDSADSYYDGFFYKDTVVVQDLGGSELRLELPFNSFNRCRRKLLVKFGSEVVKMQFLRLMTLWKNNLLTNKVKV